MLALKGGAPIRRAEDWPRWPVHTPDTVKALEDSLHANLPADCKTLIQTRFLDQTRAHIPVLDRLMEVQ